jgi:beta-ribofuranosylaminobenzene 5'-phosphate synthase
MIRVRAPSRLHFGLLGGALGPSEEDRFWPDRLGEPVLPARQFGSVGLMIEEPGVHLSLAPSAMWSARGPLAERALAFARRVATALPLTLVPHELVIDRAGPEHVGLGTGTQLGLAVARGITLAAGLPDLDAIELARLSGRGQRSALGTHGFAQGGFLVDGGKRSTDEVAPLLVRCPLPEAWRVVLAIPAVEPGLYGNAEQLAFASLAERGHPLMRTDALCRLVLLGMLPALRERDLQAFGEALHDFNARVGEMFASIQGDIYTHPRIAELVTFMRQQHVPGVGQSSWGPTVFAIVGDEEEARHLKGRIEAFSGMPVLLTRASNQGAVVSEEGG